jgi:hypothetical protein
MLIKRIVSFAAVAAFTIAMCSPAVAQEPEKLNVLGTPMVLKIDGQKTGGAMAVVEETYPPGHGAPQHVHAKEDELFYIIEGSSGSGAAMRRWTLARGISRSCRGVCRTHTRTSEASQGVCLRQSHRPDSRVSSARCRDRI